MPTKRRRNQSGVGRSISAGLAFVVVVLVSAVAGLGLMAYASAPTDVGTVNSQNNWQWFVSPDGYQVRYPKGWSVTTGSAVVFQSSQDTVTVATLKKAVESGLFPDATVQLTLHGAKATQYRDADPVTGEPIDRVVVKRSDGRVNEIRGNGPAFEMIVSSFTLLAK